jgi:hypothetical protein
VGGCEPLPIPHASKVLAVPPAHEPEEAHKDTSENRRLIHRLFQEYSEGFYVRAKDTINNKKVMVKYIGRYIRHHAIAENRIDEYNVGRVIF